jgi:hypothetical protein
MSHGNLSNDRNVFALLAAAARGRRAALTTLHTPAPAERAVPNRMPRRTRRSSLRRRRDERHRGRWAALGPIHDGRRRRRRVPRLSSLLSLFVRMCVVVVMMLVACLYASVLYMMKAYI